MERIKLIQKDKINMEYLDTGEGNKFFIEDTLGKNVGLPFTFGVAEVHPSKGIEFEYDDDGAICFCLEGTILLTDELTKEMLAFQKGDVIYIPQEEKKTIIWSAEKYAKFVFVTYPHWR